MYMRTSGLLQTSPSLRLEGFWTCGRVRGPMGHHAGLLASSGHVGPDVCSHSGGSSLEMPLAFDPLEASIPSVAWERHQNSQTNKNHTRANTIVHEDPTTG